MIKIEKWERKIRIVIRMMSSLLGIKTKITQKSTCLSKLWARKKLQRQTKVSQRMLRMKPMTLEMKRSYRRRRARGIRKEVSSKKTKSFLIMTQKLRQLRQMVKRQTKMTGLQMNKTSKTNLMITLKA